MAKPISFGELDFKIVASMDQTREKPDSQTPFRILIVGDLSGRSNRGVLEDGRPSTDWRVREVDRDNIDEVLARLRPEIQLPFAGADLPHISIRFRELDDFHPDRIYSRLEVFESLREARTKIKDPKFSAAIAAAITGDTKPKTPKKAEEQTTGGPVPHPELSDLTGGSLLDQVLDTSAGRQPDPGTSPASSDWSRFLQDIVRPHLVPNVEPHIEQLLAGVDEGISALMRSILHHPDFQALEAAWRGVDFLARGLETDERLKLHVLDISQDELAADLTASDELKNTRLYKLLVEQAVEIPGAEPWALVAGNFTFDRTVAHAELLGRLAKVAQAAGAPFIAAAHPHLLGCDNLHETPDPEDWKAESDENDQQAWETLRGIPEAAYLGLALPRFLLRLPYGSQTDPTERFEFEETTGAPVHEHYLWANPSIACAYLLGKAFSDYGWDLRPGILQDIGNLPLHMYQEDGETRLKPCAEVLLTEHAAEAILANGIMPLLSFRDQDMVRLARFQSLAAPPALLAGRWAETMQI
jgi:type VI secretion system protein ImpC